MGLAVTTGTAGRGDSFRCAVMKIRMFPLLGTQPRGQACFSSLEISKTWSIYFFFLSFQGKRLVGNLGTQTTGRPGLRGLARERAGRRRSTRKPGGGQRVRAAWCSVGSPGPGGAGTSGTGLGLKFLRKCCLEGS